MESILLVVDDRDILKLLKHLLEGEGMNVHCAACGEEALMKIKQKSFLLMITDLNMPGPDGFELTRKVREMAPHMPIIMNSDDISPETPRLALEAGITRVLGKPFHPKEMLALVREVLGKRRETVSPSQAAKGVAAGRNSWICPRCGAYYVGWSSLNICYKCGYKEESLS
jgi:DNA-binding response OmpR family regulator